MLAAALLAAWHHDREALQLQHKEEIDRLTDGGMTIKMSKPIPGYQPINPKLVPTDVPGLGSL
jgi:hypothetical protein